MTESKIILDRDGWRNINRGFISLDRVRGRIKEYFNVDEDIKNFESRNEGYLKLRSFDKSRGYTFVGGLQLSRDYENRMRDAITEITEINEVDYFEKIVVKEFVDHDNRIAGFFWRAKNE